MLTDLPLQLDVDHELSDQDYACLAEIKTVLEKFGSERRFGVTLLHRHFAVAVDEVPVEQVDAARRETRIVMRKVSDVEGVSIATAWRLDDAGPTAVARCPATCGPAARSGERCDHYDPARNVLLA